MSQGWTGILYMGTGPTGSTGPTGRTGPTGLQGAFFSTLSVTDTANGTSLLTPTSFYLGAGGAVTSQERLSLQTNGIYLQIGNAPLIPNGTTINIGLRDNGALYWLYAECVGGPSTTSVQIRMNINNGQGNVAQGSPFTYTSNQILTFSLDGVNANFLLDGVVRLTIPYTTTQAPNPLGFFANGGANAVTYSQVLFYPTGPKGVTGPTGPTGYTGNTGPTGPLPSGNYYFVQGELGTNQTIGASDSVIEFTASVDTQDWSSGDASSSFKITPTIEGYYQISLNVRWNPVATAGDQLNNQIHKNNNQIAFTQGTNVTTNSVCLSLTAFTYMNGTTDFIDFKGFSGASGGTVLTSTGTTFSLVLIQGGTSTTPTTGKTFIIDHPLNPTRHLVHACLEGPEVGVFYRGKGTITPNTTSTLISLPAYVPALANHFTVQITPLYNGQAPGLYAASDVVHGSFEVHGPPGSFYWHVHGSRGTLEVEPLRSDVVVRGDGPYKYIV